jgi:surface antigen
MSQELTKRGFFGFAIAMTVGCTVLIALASCTTPRQTVSKKKPTAEPGAMELVSQNPGGYSQCVPYARDYSGIQIYGDAWTWWSKANGRYDRGNIPRRSAVLTLKKTGKLSAGHVAVVASILDPRKILVDHANWGDNANTRSKIHVRQPVIDVSPKNDWTSVRFMNTQGTFGAVYPSHGFIYSDTEIRTADSIPPPKPNVQPAKANTVE